MSLLPVLFWFWFFMISCVFEVLIDGLDYGRMKSCTTI